MFKLIITMVLSALAPSCTFETEAADGMLGAVGVETSCGHYKLSQMVTDSDEACWTQMDKGPADCFMSAQGACGPRATEWPPGTVLTQWCPIGNPGVEVTEVEACK